MSSLAPTLARDFNARPPGYCSAARALTINRLQQPATQASNDASAVPDFAASCPAFTMAFQPIVDVDKGEVYAHEALVRGIHGEGAGHILGLVHARHRVEFDRACRAKAIELAAGLRMASRLSLNVMPNDTGRQGECFQSAVETAERFGFPKERLIFEVTESERVEDLPHLVKAFEMHQQHGFSSAIDDFGAGFAGFELFVALRPHIVKLDMELIRNIHTDGVRRAVVKGFVSTCGELGIHVVAEGVEIMEEVVALRELGIRLFQGYLFARPVVETLPAVNWEWEKRFD